jgi:tetratricopeptide (TPR) repeat protein
MNAVRYPGRYAALLLMMVAGTVFAGGEPGQQPPELPTILPERYGEEARAQIARAWTEARAEPLNAERVGRLGMALHAYEEFEAAEKCYRRARALAVSSFEWIYLQGVVEASLGWHDRAILSLREAVRRRPAYWQARLRLADSLMTAGARAESRSLYETLAREEKGQALVMYGLGRVLAAEGAHAAAVTALEEAIRLSPLFGTAHYALATSYRRLNQREKAAEHARLSQVHQLIRPVLEDPIVQTVQALNGSAAAHLQRGVELESAGNLAGAIEAHQRALSINPRFEQVQLNLITLYARSGQREKAEAAYRALQELNPNLAEGHYNYGVMLASEGDYPRAIKAFERCLAINPLHPQAPFNLGRIAELQQRYPDALEHYRRAAANRPSDRESHFQLARLLLWKGEVPEAIRALQRAVQLGEDRETPRYVYALGAAYLRAGERQTGRRHLEEARERARRLQLLELVQSIDRDLARLGNP